MLLNKLIMFNQYTLTRAHKFINIIILLIIFILTNFKTSAEEIKKIGKFKDWETIVLKSNDEMTCFAQSKPVLQSPKKNKRDSRLFVSFRQN